MNDFTIAVLGSHSALDVCRGAKDLGFKTLVVCQKGREETYHDYYRTKHDLGCIDDVIVLEKFADIVKPSVQEELKNRNCIFIPHRSFEVYVNDYDAIEKKFKIPIFGNKRLLKYEERTQKPNQYDLLKAAGIKFPKIFKNYKEIDRLTVVKAQQKKTSFERGFFFASSPSQFEEEAEKRIKSGLISEEGIKSAMIEEFIVGVSVNLNFFYSPLNKRLELLGTDTRRQTNLDGILKLPAPQQAEILKLMEVTFKEMGHMPVTLPESLLEEAFQIGERFVRVTKRKEKPGIIGPFALQSLVRPIFPELEIVVYDVSPRMPGSPGTFATPYSGYLFGENISIGKRVAMEIRQALELGRLDKVIT